MLGDPKQSLPELQRPVIGDGRIFSLSGHTMLAVNAADGSLEWAAGDDLVRERQTPLLEDGRLYLRTTSREFPWECYATEDGSPIRDEYGDYLTPRSVRPYAAKESAPATLQTR